MLGKNIKRIRQTRNLTQDKLARLADIPYTTITKIETGVIKQPSVQAVAKIAKALDVSVDKLISGIIRQ
jgi:transcriptional regulator with XRE-family HTH domain